MSFVRSASEYEDCESYSQDPEETRRQIEQDIIKDARSLLVNKNSPPRASAKRVGVPGPDSRALSAKSNAGAGSWGHGCERDLLAGCRRQCAQGPVGKRRGPVTGEEVA